MLDNKSLIRRLLCSIAEYFYELYRILTSPIGMSVQANFASNKIYISHVKHHVVFISLKITIAIGT